MEREAQKHADPDPAPDLDPQHCTELLFSTLFGHLSVPTIAARWLSCPFDLSKVSLGARVVEFFFPRLSSPAILSITSFSVRHGAGS